MLLCSYSDIFRHAVFLFHHFKDLLIASFLCHFVNAHICFFDLYCQNGEVTILVNLNRFYLVYYKTFT